MRSLFLNIEKQIRLAFLLIIISSVLGGIFSYYLLKKVNNYHQTENTITNVVLELEEARKSEKDFMLFDVKDEEFYKTGQSEGLKQHRIKLKSIKSKLSSLSNNDILIRLGLIPNLYSIKSSISNYEKSFNKLIQSKLQRGYKDYGLVGRMRNQVHALQECKSAEEQVYAFSLRRHEKDFFIRHDLTYQKKLEVTAKEFKSFILNAELSHINKNYKAERIQSINNYVKHFNKVVEIDKIIGLNNNSGIRGQLNEITSEIEPLITALYKSTNQQNKYAEQNTLIVLAISILILFLLGTIFSFYIASKISKPIIKLDEITKTIIKGEKVNYNLFKEINTNNEIQNLANNFKNMLSLLDEKIDLVNTKNKELEKTSTADKIRKWKIEGLNEIAKKIKSGNHDIETICRDVLSFIIKYTGGINGSFYILDDKLEEMIPIAHFASEKIRSSVKQASYTKGEQLIGQVWAENDVIFLSEIPDDYKEVKTSMSHIKPKNILFAPISSETEVEGIIELSSLETLSEHKKDFIITAAKDLFQTLKSIKINIKTNLLLEESNILTEELQASEEELRQNMEELQATQDEVMRVSNDKDKKINKIQFRAKVYKHILKKKYKEVIFTDTKLNTSFKIDNDNYNSINKGITPELLELISNSEIIKQGGIDTFFYKKLFINEEKIYDNFSVTKFESKKKNYYIFMIEEQRKQNITELEVLNF